jgi:hypothetical protein
MSPGEPACPLILPVQETETTRADTFVELLRRAGGVWILGGFPERLVEAYLGTRTERFTGVLASGPIGRGPSEFSVPEVGATRRLSLDATRSQRDWKSF